MNKKEGSSLVEFTVIFTILFILILIVYAMRLSCIKSEAEMTHDDLLSSELAAYKEIDLDKLGRSDDLKLIVFSDYNAAYNTFKEYLHYNLNLDENLNPKDKKFNFIKSRVNIEQFIIYNMEGNDIHRIILQENNSGGVNIVSDDLIKDGKDKTKTPCGKIVESTTLYAKIGFDIERIFGQTQHVSIDEQTDIIKQQKGWGIWKREL